MGPGICNSNTLLDGTRGASLRSLPCPAAISHSALNMVPSHQRSLFWGRSETRHIKQAPAKPKLGPSMAGSSTVLGPPCPLVGDPIRKMTSELLEGDKQKEIMETKQYLGSADPWGSAGAPFLCGPLTASPSPSSGCSGGHPTCPSHAWTPLATRGDDDKARSARRDVRRWQSKVLPERSSMSLKKSTQCCRGIY